MRGVPDAGKDAFVPVDAAQDVLPESPITSDAAPDVLPDAPLPPRCVLLQADGPPMQIVSFPNQHADAPSLAVVDRGTPGSPANVAVQAFRTGGDGFEHAIFAGKLSVGDAWPDGVETTQTPVKVGTDSHGWAEMSMAPGGLREVAISWLGDPGMSSRTMFRRIDADSWSALDPVDLSYEGSSALGLVAGAGTGDMGIGYAGLGYGIVWRRSSHLPDNPVSPVVAVLDQNGSLLIGPHRVADPMQSPGRSPSITWSGSAYLLATTFRECVPGDALCSPDAIVITRVRPASGDAWDDSGVDFVTAIPTTNPGLAPGRASIGSNGTDTWVAWSEGPSGNDEAPRRIVAQRLDSQGNVVGSPVQVDDGLVNGTYVVHANEGCAGYDPPTDSCYDPYMQLVHLGTTVVQGYGDAHWKYVIAHETGHMVAHRAMGLFYYDYNDSATQRLCKCNYDTSWGNTVHCLQSREQSGGAQEEGFGHAYASRVYNDPYQANGTFVYYKPFEYPAYNTTYPPVPKSAFNVQLWLESYCLATSRGVEFDWLTFEYNVGSWDRSNPTSIPQLFDIYRIACTGSSTTKCNNQTINWSNLLAAAATYYGPFDPRYERFRVTGQDFGVDH